MPIQPRGTRACAASWPRAGPPTRPTLSAGWPTSGLLTLVQT